MHKTNLCLCTTKSLLPDAQFMIFMEQYDYEFHVLCSKFRILKTHFHTYASINNFNGVFSMLTEQRTSHLQQNLQVFASANEKKTFGPIFIKQLMLFLLV